MKTIHVVAAIIFRTVTDANGKKTKQVFTTQRGYGEFKDGWEFPGGKIEVGETPQEALTREIHEELDTEISVGNKLGTIEYDYPTFHLSMDCFECEIISGKLTLLEHENSAWLNKDNLHSVDWLPADLTILDSVESILGR